MWHIKLLNWPTCSSSSYELLAKLAPIFCGLAALGIFYRWTSKLSFLALLTQWGYLHSFGKITNGWHTLIVAVGLLALASRSSKRPPEVSYGWCLQVIKVYVVWVYFVNGLAKVMHGAEWAFSDNFFLHLWIRPFLGPLGEYLLTVDPIYSTVLAIGAMVVVELCAPLALFSRRIGYMYFFIWMGFHLGVTAMLSGHRNYYAYILVNLIFLPLDKIWEIFPVRKQNAA